MSIILPGIKIKYFWSEGMEAASKYDRTWGDTYHVENTMVESQKKNVPVKEKLSWDKVIADLIALNKRRRNEKKRPQP